MAKFASFAYPVTLVTLLVRDAAGVGSLLGLANRANEAFPFMLLLWGDFEPLVKGTIVDLRGDLVVFGLSYDFLQKIEIHEEITVKSSMSNHCSHLCCCNLG